MDGSDKKELKIILGGRWAVGKSSLRRNIMGEARFKRNYLPTVGSDFSYKEIVHGGEEYRLLIWDLAGEVRFRQFRSLYFQAASGAFLVFDLTDKESFEILEEWIDDLKNQTAHQGVPIIILGNKSDLILDPSELAVTDEQVNRKIRQFEEHLDNKFDIEYIKTSALTGKNVEDALNKLLDKSIDWQPAEELYQ